MTPLPTEEDVLAFLVLNMALGEISYETFGGPEWSAVRSAIDDWKAHGWPAALEAVAHERLLDHDRIHVAAIADSERRLEAERARDAVVGAAEEVSPATLASQPALRRAVLALRRAKGSR